MSTRNDPSLIMAAAAGDIAARDAVIQQNMGAVKKLAVHFSRKSKLVDEDDLLHEGVLTLIDTIGYFNTGCGVKFISYAYISISRAMSRYIDRCVSVTGRPARQNMRKNMNSPMARPVKCVSRVSFRPTQHSESVVNETVAAVQRAIDSLDERESAIVRQRMNGDTLVVIGKSYGLTKQRVQQIEERAHDKLRELLGHI